MCLGAVIYRPDASGNTPLHLAMESGHAEAAVLLIEAGADRHRVQWFPYLTPTDSMLNLSAS